jgi:aminopeptidase 2
LSLLIVDEDGKPQIRKDIVLDTREKEIELDTSKPFKLNAGTVSPGTFSNFFCIPFLVYS